MVPLKYLSNCRKTIEMPLINREINLILTWPVNCVIVSTNVANQGATFLITDTKLYVSVVFIYFVYFIFIYPRIQKMKIDIP